jgi:CRISPR-associated protein Cas2
MKKKKGYKDPWQERCNEYRIMWIFVFFDLPTETKAQKKTHAKFRKDIMGQGFKMFQFSIYSRWCGSRESAEAHTARVEKVMPEEGKISIMSFTDKQFGMMRTYYGKVPKPKPEVPQQLSMF